MGFSKRYEVACSNILSSSSELLTHTGQEDLITTLHFYINFPHRQILTTLSLVDQ
jgi:hypothetical protein